MNSSAKTVRILRVFVSSPGDVKAERATLDEVIASINNTDGIQRGYRLELLLWETSVVPQIGPSPQEAVNDQTPTYDIYLGIMSARFGTPTQRHASGTEEEFEDARRKWQEAGSPWIMFYFDDGDKALRTQDEIRQYLKVSEFRDELERQGIVATYRGVRGDKECFHEKVSDHLRNLAYQLLPSTEAPAIPTPLVADSWWPCFRCADRGLSAPRSSRRCCGPVSRKAIPIWLSAAWKNRCISSPLRSSTC